MKPLKSAPTLFTFNTLGIAMYGKRDADPASGTYIKTRCLCAVFMPLVPLDSYRVADAPGGGWYFLGKEPISGLARGWRWCVFGLLLLLAASIAWSSHVKSPGYRIGKTREQAAGLAAAGKPLEAAERYRAALVEGLGERAEWQQAMAALLTAEISSGDAARAAAAVAYADQHRRVPASRDGLLPDLADQALAAAAKCGDPAAAERILSAFNPDPTDLARVHQALRAALESLHLARPDDQEVRVKLALLREEFGEAAGALELLEPAAGELGSGEGARLFGSLLLGEGRVAEALPHLERYVTPRLAGWKSAEASLERTYRTAQENALERLNRSGGPAGFKSRYEAAKPAEQEQMVGEYLAQEVQRDRAFLAAQESYQAAAKIVPSIMDLGVCRLRMAQATADPAERQALLKDAEEAFLSLKGVAGESDEFRLFLGQIYFWSGREPEGRALFDELLASKQRDFATLYGLADILRDLGEDNDARKLLEEAFPKAANEDEKVAVIGLRSMLARSADEKIEWLSKAGNSAAPMMVINLAEARGGKAEESGDLEGAGRHYREALAGYGKLPRTAASLNNSALLHSSLYRLEGKGEDFEKAARLISEAVELEPADSILSSNAADFQLTAAVVRLAGDRIHPKLLQRDPGLTSLRFLYQREEEKKALIAALKADPNFRKALSHYWDALLLSPKNSGFYAWGAGVFTYLEDRESLAKLLAKAAEQDFDFTSQREDKARHLKRERDDEIRDALKLQRDSANALAASLEDPRSRALAQAFVASARLGGFAIGETTGSPEWLADLKAAARNAPCSGLQSMLEAALGLVALEKLGADLPEAAAIIESNRRLLDASDILRLLVRARGEMGERVRRHPAVVEARAVAALNLETFPSHVSLADWLLLDGRDPAADPRLRELAAANETDRLSARLLREIQYEGPSALLGRFWLGVFEGDSEAARALIPEIEAAGVKLPPMF
jgi:hypothetical protein